MKTRPGSFVARSPRSPGILPGHTVPPCRWILVPGQNARATVCLFALTVALSLVAFHVQATDYTIRRESWLRDSAEGWTNRMDNWVFALTAQSLDPSAIAGTYPAQPLPLPSTDAFVADASASGGIFTGDYTAGSNVPLHVSFDFLAAESMPSLLLLRLVGTAGGVTNTFHAPLTNQLSGAGSWQHVTVPLQYGFADWVGPGGEAFTNTLTDVQRLEVQATRRGTNLQTYAIDNFAVTYLVPGGTATNDLDGDGLPDYWEADNFGGPTNAIPGLDGDHDTLSNWAEFVAGTDPHDELSYLRIGGVGSVAQRYTVWLASVLGRQYQLGWKYDLDDPAWTWSTNWSSASGGYMGLTPTNAASPAFYRLRVTREE